MRTAWILIFFIVLIWSLIAPKDYFIWVLEVSPTLVALAILAVTEKQFPLTPLCYQLILAQCIILMVGGHYTYAEVPLFDWLRDEFGLVRNNYDKVGHFAQGVVPAMVAREILLRKAVVNGRGWMNFLIVSFCLGFSAFYELVEWWVAVLSGTAADAFLATQGYVWDTQSDMGYALFGAVLALALLGRVHDRQLERHNG